MDADKPFLVLRYSLVEEDQHSLHVDPLPIPKGRAILESILNDREFVQNGVSYSFVGFAPAIPSSNFNFPENRFFVGKTAKLRQTHVRSEEHTSELQSLMRISSAVFCLKKQINTSS